MEVSLEMMNRGTGLFWLLAVALFGGAVYFAVHVAQMKAALEQGARETAQGEAEERGEP
jgi:hypothetical protein